MKLSPDSVLTDCFLCAAVCFRCRATSVLGRLCACPFLLQCLMSHLSRKFSYSAELRKYLTAHTHNGNRFQKKVSATVTLQQHPAQSVSRSARNVHCIIAQMMCLHFHINVTCLAPFVCPLDASPPLNLLPSHNRLLLFALGPMSTQIHTLYAYIYIYTLTYICAYNDINVTAARHFGLARPVLSRPVPSCLRSSRVQGPGPG